MLTGVKLVNVILSRCSSLLAGNRCETIAGLGSYFVLWLWNATAVFLDFVGTNCHASRLSGSLQPSNRKKFLASHKIGFEQWCFLVHRRWWTAWPEHLRTSVFDMVWWFQRHLNGRKVDIICCCCDLVINHDKGVSRRRSEIFAWRTHTFIDPMKIAAVACESDKDRTGQIDDVI